MVHTVRGWFIVSFLNFSVWVVLGINQGFDGLHPWWIWAAGGWGAALLGAQYLRQRKNAKRRIGGEHAPKLGEQPSLGAQT